MKNADKPAFPLDEDAVNRMESTYDGLSKREYFAIKVLQGIMSSNECGIAHHPKTACEWAVNVADALLEELDD